MRQIPYDPFHAVIIGCCGQVIVLLVACLTASALRDLNTRIQQLPKPGTWTSMPKISVTVQGTTVNMSGQQVKEAMQLLPAALDGWLGSDKIRNIDAIKKIRNSRGDVGIEELCAAMYKAVVLQAEVVRLVYAPEIRVCSRDPGLLQQEADNLERALVACNTAVVNAWQGLKIFNVIVINRHAPMAHYYRSQLDYSVMSNCSCARMETMHGCMRKALRYSNHKHTEVDCMERNNAQQALFRVATLAYTTCLSDAAINILKNDTNFLKMMTLHQAVKTYAGKGDDEEAGPEKARGVGCKGEGHLPITSARAVQGFEGLDETVEVLSWKNIELPKREKATRSVSVGKWYTLKSAPGDDISVLFVVDCYTFMLGGTERFAVAGYRLVSRNEARYGAGFRYLHQVAGEDVSIEIFAASAVNLPAHVVDATYFDNASGDDKPEYLLNHFFLK